MEVISFSKQSSIYTDHKYRKDDMDGRGTKSLWIGGSGVNICTLVFANIKGGCTHWFLCLCLSLLYMLRWNRKQTKGYKNCSHLKSKPLCMLKIGYVHTLSAKRDNDLLKAQIMACSNATQVSITYCTCIYVRENQLNAYL